jgi:colanic acid biosynthesis glycosyl transferase WcaI
LTCGGTATLPPVGSCAVNDHKVAHILVLSLVFPPDGVSTAQLVGDLTVDLRSRGHQLTVVTSTPHYNHDLRAEQAQPRSAVVGPLIQQSSWHGVPVYHVYVPTKGPNVLLRLLAWIGFHVLSTVTALVFVHRPDVIFAPTPPLTIGVNAWLIGLFKRCPFIYNVQELYPDLAINLGALRNPLAIKLLYALERWTYRAAASVAVISPRMRLRLLEKGVPAEKVVVIPNFVDIGDLRPGEQDNPFTRAHGLAGRFVASYAGNMGPAQGVDIILEAAEKLRDVPDLVVALIGGGTEVSRLADAIERKRLSNVRLIPHQPYAEVPNIYAGSSVCLVLQAPGIGADAIPSKVYRIMACARPIVACADANSDLAQLVREAGCGQVLPPGDADALARALMDAYQNRALWEARGRSGRSQVEQHYGRTEVSAQYDAMVTAVVGSTPRG